MKPVDPWDKMSESERSVMVLYATEHLRAMMRETMAERHHYEESGEQESRSKAVDRLRRECDATRDGLAIAVKNMCDRVHNREKK